MECKGVKWREQEGDSEEIIKEWEVDVLVLVDTKLEGSTDNILISIWSSRPMGCK